MEMPTSHINGLTAENLTRCPSCNNEMRAESQWIRMDQKYNRKVRERVLICDKCKIKIRQHILLE